jgi:hypothetical protein
METKMLYVILSVVLTILAIVVLIANRSHEINLNEWKRMELGSGKYPNLCKLIMGDGTEINVDLDNWPGK